MMEAMGKSVSNRGNQTLNGQVWTPCQSRVEGQKVTKLGWPLHEPYMWTKACCIQRDRLHQGRSHNSDGK